MADETLRYGVYFTGEHGEPDEITAAFWDEEQAQEWASTRHLPTAVREMAQANEPRAIVRAFALAMERKLAANDATKGGWRDTGTFALLDLMRHEISEFQVAMYRFVNAEDRDVAEAELALLRQDVLDEAADIGNYLMMLCQVIGALSPTDERGR